MRLLVGRPLHWVKTTRRGGSLFASTTSVSTHRGYQGDVHKDLESFARLLQEQNLHWLDAAVDLPAKDATLFLKNQAHVDFPFPEERDLQRLYEIAPLVSFGVGKEPVQPSSRILLPEQFGINLRPPAALLQQIDALMLGVRNCDSESVPRPYVRVELRQMNIYGPGDSLKPRKDKPKKVTTDHFGSLVICLPTNFSGGACVLRSAEGKEVRFDWASCFAKTKEGKGASKKAQVQAVAFVNDLEHWIEPVERGYRVTITFDLYCEDVPTEQISNSFLRRVEQREECRSLRALQESKKLKGKNVVFPLVHDYSARRANRIVLKGGDAYLFNELEKMGVEPKVMFFYESGPFSYDENEDDEEGEDEDDDEDKKDDEEYDGEDGDEEESVCTKICYLTDAVQCDTGDVYGRDYEKDEPMHDFAKRYKVVWARAPMQTKFFSAAAIHNDNDVSLAPYFGSACILTKWK